MNETEMTDLEEEEDENKENKPPPLPPVPRSLFSYSNISAQILKFLPKSFNGKRKRTTESQEQDEAVSEKKRKKPSVLSSISSAITVDKSMTTPKKDYKTPIADKSSQYMIYMSQREPFDI